MCSAKIDPPAFVIPELLVKSQSGGATTTAPQLFAMKDGQSAVRSLKVEMGPCGEMVRVTAELLPSSVMLKLGSPALIFMLDGQAVTSITLADGTEVRFG